METNNDSIVSVSAAVLVWLFGVLVFLPLAEDIDPDGLPLLVTLVVFVAFTVFLVRGLKGFSNLIDTASETMVKKLIRRKRMDRTQRMRIRIKIALEAASIAVVYLLYSPMLSRIHPSVNGIGMIIALLGIGWILLRNAGKQR